MERVLVTGVAGFIGSHLADHLLRRGVAVTGLDSRSPTSDPGAAENLAGLISHQSFHLVVADLVTADLTPPDLAVLPGIQQPARPAVSAARLASDGRLELSGCSGVSAGRRLPGTRDHDRERRVALPIDSDRQRAGAK